MDSLHGSSSTAIDRRKSDTANDRCATALLDGNLKPFRRIGNSRRCGRFGVARVHVPAFHALKLASRDVRRAADGTFEFIECPACGSDDTSATPRADGVEEVECTACGTITSLQLGNHNPGDGRSR